MVEVVNVEVLILANCFLAIIYESFLLHLAIYSTNKKKEPNIKLLYENFANKCNFKTNES